MADDRPDEKSSNLSLDKDLSYDMLPDLETSTELDAENASGEDSFSLAVATCPGK